MKNVQIHITGPQGAGKTTVRNIIEQALKAHYLTHARKIEIFEHTPAPASEPEAAPVEDKTGTDFGRKPRSPLMALLQLAALAGAINGFGADGEDDAPLLSGPPSDAMRELLEASTVLHSCEKHGNAFLALPRNLGEQWHALIVEAIKADNVPGVRSMLERAGLMK